MLIDRLQKASFKGIEFLVQNSSVKFGQKTVVHQYPNANRTEVEFLGAAEDTFSLDIFIHDSDESYIAKRNALKNALLSPDIGILVHPYEGSILCSVVDFASLGEKDTEFGIARFSVTFQKTSKKLFPTTSILNSAVIRDLFSGFSGDLAGSVADGYQYDGVYQGVFTNTMTRLQALNSAMLSVQSIVPLTSGLANAFNSKLTAFGGGLVSFAQSPTLLAAALKNVFSGLDLIAVKPLDNIAIYKSFFDYGDSQAADIIPPITVEQATINDNDQLLRQFVQAQALSLSYAAIATVEFDDDQQLDQYQQLLEAEYQKIITFASSDVSFGLSDLRNQAQIYFDNQKVRRVITIQVPKNPLTKINYLLYGNLDDFNKLYELNGRANPVQYEGTIKVLTEA